MQLFGKRFIRLSAETVRLQALPVSHKPQTINKTT